MKVAVCVTGQSRVRTGHENLIKTFAHLNPVYFVHTWNEPPFSQWVLDSFNPRAYKLDDPDIIRVFKKKLYDEYKALQSNELILEDRKKLMNGNRISTKYGCMIHYDGALKLFYSMNAVSGLISDNFDYIIKVRPDLNLKTIEPITLSGLKDNQIVCDANHMFGGVKESGGSYLMSDQFFYGGANIMHKVLKCWTSLAALLYQEDPKETRPSQNALVGGRGRRPWLHTETILRRYATDMCGAEIVGSDNIEARVHRIGLEGDTVHDYRRHFNHLVQVN